MLMAACGRNHTMLLLKNGSVWSFGDVTSGALGLGKRHQLDGRTVRILYAFLPERIDAQRFDNAHIASIACGDGHSAALTNLGALYTWGTGVSLGYDDEYNSLDQPSGASHKFGPRPIVQFLPDGLRIGCHFDMDSLFALAFAMGTHPRLGNGASVGPVDADVSLRKKGKLPVSHNNTKPCPISFLSTELVRLIIQYHTRPQGPIALLEGVVRLLGGTMS